MTKYKWIKIKDVTGYEYEFEDAEMKDTFTDVIVYFIAPVGKIKKVFPKRNVISFECVLEEA